VALCKIYRKPTPLEHKSPLDSNGTSASIFVSRLTFLKASCYPMLKRFLKIAFSGSAVAIRALVSPKL